MVSPSHPSREAYYHVLSDTLPPRTLVVTALGNASYLWATIRDAAENFYLEDAMGLALPLALGLAVSQPERQVAVVEGDGGLMMHLGGLVTVGAVAPPNLTVLLIDNGMHGASGGQALASEHLDLPALARATGIEAVAVVDSEAAFRTGLSQALERDGLSFLALGTAPDLQIVVPPAALNPVAVKRRFQAAVELPHYVSTIFGGGII